MTNHPAYRGLRRTLSRDALLGAATELIGRHGFSQVSIDDIVARAGVAKGTFYNHFQDKSDIAHHVALGVRHEVRDQIAKLKVHSTDPAMHLSIALTQFLNLAVFSPHKAGILMTLLTVPSDVGAPMNARLRTALETGQSTGRFSFPSLDTALAFVLGVVAGGFRSIMDQPDETDFTDHIRHLVGHCLIGLGVSPDDAAELAAAPLSPTGEHNSATVARRKSAPV